MNALTKLNEQMQRKRDELRQRRMAIKRHSEKLAAIFADVEVLGGEPHTDGDWIFVPVNGDKVKFLAFVRMIAKHGFRAPKVEKGATGFNQLEILGEGDSKLYVYFQFSSTACRRVKIGTKTVEQDVYETVCDEMMPYAEVTPTSDTANEIAI